jgi:hypothetical protein
MPPGSRPGMISLASAPTIKPMNRAQIKLNKFHLHIEETRPEGRLGCLSKLDQLEAARTHFLGQFPIREIYPVTSTRVKVHPTVLSGHPNS